MTLDTSRIAVVSDLHWLSNEGLTNPYVCEIFSDFIRKVPKGALGVFNGDVFAGVDARWIESLQLGNLEDQFVEGKELIDHFYDACGAIISSAGTSSHAKAGLGFDFERILCRLFGSQVHREQLFFRDRKTGVRILFQHGRSGALVYKESILRRELRFAHEHAAWGEIPQIDVLVRSHLHSYVAVESTHDKACITPCFQLPTRYIEAGSLGWKPELGGLLIELRSGKTICDKVRFLPVTYPLPERFRQYVTLRPKYHESPIRKMERTRNEKETS